ncbi:MAG TPA: sulfite exporter TauE/SafE family protein [Thermodesulfovibrionales bacterium]|nr:sulfite exporter TauE/SafE family protein [Thermodesulfovibrionales bacterium]
MTTGYILAFTTGFLGAFGHCIGMCGPLVASYALYEKTHFSRYPAILPHVLYNAGRITTYVFIGALMGISGSFVSAAGRLSGIQNTVEMLAGSLMIVMGLGIAGVFKDMRFIERHTTLIMRLAMNMSEINSSWRYFPLGLLLGFLPCGLSYSVFIGAAATGSMPSAMLFLFCFGMGTVPALLLFGIVVTYVSTRIRGWLYRMSGIVVVTTGAYFLIRGFISHAQV